jgi:hypothetical protein
MSISSLGNMSVPLTDGTKALLLMPKLKYRFRVSFIGFAVDATTEMTKQVIEATRPKVKFEEIKIPVYNSQIYLAGKPEWDPIEITFRDDASGTIQTLVGQQLQKQFDFTEQASARSGIDYKFTTVLEILDGGNATENAGNIQILDTFRIYGCFIQNADYGDLKYEGNEVVTVKLSIRYDNAIQFQNGNSTPIGIGSTFTRPTDNSAGITGAAGSNSAAAGQAL